MRQMDEMPDSWAAKYHEDRRQHGEVSAVTMTNSEQYRRGHARIAWGRERTAAEEVKAWRDLLTPPEPDETRQYANNFDSIFGKD
jgi:hypothetical protein